MPMRKDDDEIIIPGDDEVEQYAGNPASAATDDPVEQLRKERDEYKDKCLRAQAETINTSRRLQQQHSTSLKLANMELARELLPVVDNLDRTIKSLDHLPPDDPTTVGVRLIAEEFNRVLKNHGIVPIEAVGKPFDPAMHEALMHDRDTDLPPNTVTRELERGYMMHDRVLRPARVAVAVGDGSGDGHLDENA
jgi:molecular chaperone GrpE